MKRKKIARDGRLVIGLSVLVLAGCSGIGSIMQPQGPLANLNSQEAMFIKAAQTWDINKDSLVSCDEWQQYTGELFKTADTNVDGFLGDDEYKTVIKTDRLFQVVALGYFDRNGDKKVSPQEFAETKNPAFTHLDRDKNCVIDRTEMVTTRAPRHKKKEEKSNAPDTTQTGPY